MTMNNHINNLNASDTHGRWVLNYSAVKPVTVKMIICDSDYMERVASTTSEHRFVTILFSIYRGLKLMLFMY